MLLSLCLYYMKETVTAVAHRAPHRAKLFHRFRTHPIDIYEHIDSRSRRISWLYLLWIATPVSSSSSSSCCCWRCRSSILYMWRCCRRIYEMSQKICLHSFFVFFFFYSIATLLMANWLYLLQESVSACILEWLRENSEFYFQHDGRITIM